MNPVEVLEQRYLPMLGAHAIDVRQRHPTFFVKARSGSVGRKTSFQGYNVYLECWRKDSSDPEPNCVALTACVRDLPGTPMLCDLGVGWGGDGVAPCGSLELLSTEVEFGPDAISLIDDAIPRLQEHLDHCLNQWEAKYPVHSS